MIFLERVGSALRCMKFSFYCEPYGSVDSHILPVYFVSNSLAGLGEFGFVADGDLQGRVGVVVTELRWAMWGCGSIGPSGKFLHG